MLLTNDGRARTRTVRGLARITVTTLLVGGVVATGASSASAAETLSNVKQITQIPTTIVRVNEGRSTVAPGDAAGGPGTSTINSAVQTGCGLGSAFADPQWFALPLWSGKLALRPINHSPFFVSRAPVYFAVLDADSRTVVACSPTVISLDTTHPRLLVAYYKVHKPVCTDDELTVYGCTEARDDYRLEWTGGSAPTNDAPANAKVISSLPYATTVDTTFATVPSGEYFNPSEDCFGLPELTASAWWTFTPTTTGSYWFQSGATWGEDSYVHVIPTAAGGGPDLSAPPLAGCGGQSSTLTAGKKYWVAVYNAHSDTDFYTFVGSKAVLRVATTKAAMPPSAGTTVNSAAGSATISWSDTAATGGGYLVARDGTDASGVGPWSTVVPEGGATSLTFTHLRPWVSYNLTVTPGAGTSTPGYPVQRAVFLTSPTPSVSRTVAAVPGVQKVAVSWTKPAFIGNSTVINYRIRRYNSTGSTLLQTVTVSGSTRSYTFTGLTTGSGARFDVTAINTQGKGVVSAKTAAVTVG